MATADDAATTKSQSMTWAALALATAAVLVMVVLAAMDHDGPAWLLQPLLGLAAAVTAWRAGGTSPRRNLLAFAALIVGVVMVLIFLGWLVAQA